MKNWVPALMLGVILLLAYQLSLKKERVKTIVKSDTVRVVDTVTVKDTVKYFAQKTKADTIRIHDTILIRYSAPFKIGSDTLNAKGVVAFDTLFSFRDISFTYPKHTTTITDSVFVTEVQEKINWIFVLLGIIAGLVFGVSL